MQARAQAGFTLIELMISVVIGLIVVFGLSLVFVNLKQTFSQQHELTKLQDNERLALSVLTTTIQSARYFPDPMVDTASTALPAVSGFIAGQGITGTTGATSDTITSRYVTGLNDDIMDCLGDVNTTLPSRTVINTFSISTTNELVCSPDGGTTLYTIVPNVKTMKVLYGTDTAGSGAVDRYLDATAVETGAFWLRVKTARVTLSFINPYAAQSGQPPTVDWTQTINVMNQI